MAAIRVKSGRGGSGEIVHPGSGKWVQNFKYKPGGRQAKKVFLSAGEPAGGEHGGDVVIVADGSYSDLVHLQNQSLFSAKNGVNGNPAEGSCGPRSQKPPKKYAKPLKICVPPGTVVKSCQGKVIGELTRLGDYLVVARGGRGGPGFKIPSHKYNQKVKYKEGVEIEEVSSKDWNSLVKGEEGEEVRLQLILRIVADVGIVGLPNAGKSSLLSVMTGARPRIAPYPFTTLMPNLGVMSPKLQDEDDFEQWGELEQEEKQRFQKICADMPGLIEGAHLGRGLGRMFLRHLSRTRVLLHVVDASRHDPASDYRIVREELYMYNPEYCTRPYVVALNKVDLPDASELREEIKMEIDLMSKRLCDEYPKASRLLDAVVFTSAKSGEGIDDLCEQLDIIIAKQQEDIIGQKEENVFDWDTRLPEEDPRFSQVVNYVDEGLDNSVESSFMQGDTEALQFEAQ